MPISVETLESYTPDQIALLWNKAFEGHQLPLKKSPRQVRLRLQQGRVDLAHSVGAFDRGAFVGFSLLGHHEQRGWIAGFGIAPRHRGKGLAKKLFQAQAQRVKQLGLRAVRLEVAVGNEAARRTYEAAGFAPLRELLVFEGSPGVAEPLAELRRLASPVAVKQIGLAAYGQYRSRFDLAPSVERSFAYWSLHPEATETLAAGSPDQPEALLAVRVKGDHLQLVDGVGSQGALAALLTKVWPAGGAVKVSLAEEPATTPLTDLLRQLQVPELGRYQEMGWAVS